MKNECCELCKGNHKHFTGNARVVCKCHSPTELNLASQEVYRTLGGADINDAKIIIPSSQSIEEDWEDAEKEEWGGWKFVSEMLDNPDEIGIYPTSKCYRKLYEFVCEQKVKAVAEYKAKLMDKIENVTKDFLDNIMGEKLEGGKVMYVNDIIKIINKE